jgi:hypothetical protein
MATDMTGSGQCIFSSEMLISGSQSVSPETQSMPMTPMMSPALAESISSRFSA